MEKSSMTSLNSLSPGNLGLLKRQYLQWTQPVSLVTEGDISTTFWGIEMVQVLLLIEQLYLSGLSLSGLKFLLKPDLKFSFFQFIGNRRTEDIPEVPLQEEEEKVFDEEKKDDEKPAESTGYAETYAN